MPQRIRDFGVAALALGAVFVALATMDDRVPGHLGEAIRAAGNGQWMAPGSAVSQMMASVAASPATNNGIVLVFIVVAAVLVVLMVRS